MAPDPSCLGLQVERCYGSVSDNLLIHGENLAVLKALLPGLAGAVRLIYLDPPFNTGGRFAHYCDDLDSQAWLAMMEERLPLLRELLRPDGVIYVHLDDSELAYCKVAMDRIFVRQNYVTTIVVQAATPSGFKTVNPGPADVTEYVLMYCRDRSALRYQTQYLPRQGVDVRRFAHYVVNQNDPPSAWRFGSVAQAALEEIGFTGSPRTRRAEAERALGGDEVRRKVEEFALAHAGVVFETKTLQSPGRHRAADIARSKAGPGVLRVVRDGRPDLYLYRGRQLYFLAQSLREVGGRLVVVQPLSNLWTDIPTSSLFAEGGVDFRYGKKPERLLSRLIELVTEPGDYVLDAFAGSGTTGAVAHKLGRRWIMIEHGPQAITHIVPRLCRVIGGEDQSGISAGVEWKGGGGFALCVPAEVTDAGSGCRGEAAPLLQAQAPPPTIVVAAVVQRGERFLLAQRADSLRWEFPGGKLLPGEDAREALCREMREELGLEVEVGEPLEVVTVPAPCHLVILFFAARLSAGEPQRRDCADFCWADPGELAGLPMEAPDRRMAGKLARHDARH